MAKKMVYKEIGGAMPNPVAQESTNIVLTPSGFPMVTRPAPSIGANTGGDMELVVPPGGVRNTWFHMPD